MAKAIVTFCEVGGRTSNGGSVATIQLGSVKTQVITTSSTNVVVTPTTNTRYGYVTISAVGGAIWVTSGATPVAGVTGFYIPDGQSKDFSIKSGDKIAVVDATV